jgi:hypothetical protein
MVKYGFATTMAVRLCNIQTIFTESAFSFLSKKGGYLVQIRLVYQDHDQQVPYSYESKALESIYFRSALPSKNILQSNTCHNPNRKALQSTFSVPALLARTGGDLYRVDRQTTILTA